MKYANNNAKAIQKLRNTYSGDVADLIWEKSVRGFDSVLSYNPDTDKLEVSVFSTGTVWNPESRNIYLRRFTDPLNIEVYDWSELGCEFREYDGEQELSDFAAERGIDLDERYQNIHYYYLTESADIAKELLEGLKAEMPPVYCYAANQFESPLIEARGATEEECIEQILSIFAEWEDIDIDRLSVKWCQYTGKDWIWIDDWQTDVWIEDAEEPAEPAMNHKTA